MVKDVKVGHCYRADKIIAEHIEKLLGKKKDLPQEEKSRLQRISDEADTYSKEQLDQVIKELQVKATLTGNELSESIPFNLMFGT